MPFPPLQPAAASTASLSQPGRAAARRRPLAALVAGLVAIAALAPAAQAAPIDDAVNRAIHVARVRMHDKEGTDFRNLTARERGASGWIVCGELNARKTFGAYNGFKRFMVLAGSEFLLEGDPRFKGEWARLCSD